MPDRANRKMLIINADDFGWSEGISRGLIEAHLRGVVTSTTIAANMPAAEASLRLLAEAPRLGVGVHLNVSQGPPLSDGGRRLAGSDGVMNRTAIGVVRDCLLHPRLLKAIEAEFDAQVRWVLDHGLRPTHLDSHRHAHAFGPIGAIVKRLAWRYDIPCVRRLVEPRLRGLPPASRGARRVARAIGLAFTLWPHDRTLYPACGTLGLAHTGRIDSTYLLAVAAALQPGLTELMVHPGDPAGLTSADTRLLESRRQEQAALCDAAIREAFAAQKVELVHYGHLAGADLQRRCAVL